MASISEEGLLQPILVRPLVGGFEVVAGNRRLAACKALGIRKIACYIMNLNEKEAYEAALVENLQHRTLEPLQESRAFERYVREYGYGGETELARRIGKSEQYVSQRIRLLSLPGEVLQKVTRRLVNYSQAIELIGLNSEEQQLISNLAIKDKLSSRAVRRFAKKIKEEHHPSLKLDFESDCPMAGNDRAVRTIRKCIALLKTTLIRLDDAIRNLGESDWVTLQILQAESKEINQLIDTLMRVRTKLNREDYRMALGLDD